MSEGDAIRQRMQHKTFVKWVNHHLKKDKDASLQVENLKTDFSDGIRLIRLVELISDESLGKYNKKPISKFQKLENLNIPLAYINKFIKEQKIANQYSAENILEENEVLILGMIWSLILRFAVLEVSEGEKTAKEGLLLWAQKKVDEASKGKIQVNNFHTSWQDGAAFCALIHAFRPDLIDRSKFSFSGDVSVHTSRLNLAFDVAQQHLGIDRMLDAGDMIGNRPDEKSVMTYISFFWREFASTKKRALAAETIGRVIARENEFTLLQQAYEEQARALARWIQESKARFEAGFKPGSSGATPGTAAGELQATLEAYLEYGSADRPAKIHELMEVEALYTSIESRLAALGRSYVPPEDCSLPALQRWWEELTLAERKYEEGIKISLGNLKRMGGLVRLFHSKASKLDHWLATKAAWLQASHGSALAQLGKPPPELIRLPPPSPSRRSSAAAVGGGGETAMNDTAPPPPISPAHSRQQAVAGSAPSTPSAGGNAGAEGVLSPSQKRASFFGDLFANIAGSFHGLDGEEEGDGDAAGGAGGSDSPANGGGDDVEDTPDANSGRRGSMRLTLDEKLAKEGTPSKPSLPALTSQRSLNIFADELAHENSRQAEAGASLSSVSAALARINLFKAYEEEQASRKLSLDALQKLVNQLDEMGCPTIDKIRKRFSALHAAVEALAAAAATYRSDLEAVLEKHKALDEERLDFAKRAEGLNRWLEESHDMLSEVLAVDNVYEADAVRAELDGFKSELAGHKVEAARLSEFEQQMDERKMGHNPYSRFRVEELMEKLGEVDAACVERESRLVAARVRIDEIDRDKKAFADAAEKALAYIKGEKALLEGNVKGVLVLPDDPDSIAKGKEKLAFLSEYAAKSSERAECLRESQALYDTLMAAGEMDNPYTRHSMASLTSALDQLEKLVRDFSNLVEGQLARAVASITPEQHAELREAFVHFDKSGDNMLNEVEFTAAMKSLDFEGAESMFTKFADVSHTINVEPTYDDEGGEREERCMTFDNFLSVVLQQFKDKDTMDGLIAAFRTLANGKDTIGSDVLSYREGDTTSLKDTEVAFLQEKLGEAAPDGSFFYAPFAASVYGTEAPPTPPPTPIS